MSAVDDDIMEAFARGIQAALAEDYVALAQAFKDTGFVNDPIIYYPDREKFGIDPETGEDTGLAAFAEALELPKVTFASMFDGAGEGEEAAGAEGHVEAADLREDHASKNKAGLRPVRAVFPSCFDPHIFCPRRKNSWNPGRAEMELSQKQSTSFLDEVEIHKPELSEQPASCLLYTSPSPRDRG